jgi:hypothetical protein
MEGLQQVRLYACEAAVNCTPASVASDSAVPLLSQRRDVPLPTRQWCMTMRCAAPSSLHCLGMHMVCVLPPGDTAVTPCHTGVPPQPRPGWQHLPQHLARGLEASDVHLTSAGRPQLPVLGERGQQGGQQAGRGRHASVQPRSGVGGSLLGGSSIIWGVQGSGVLSSRLMDRQVSALPHALGLLQLRQGYMSSLYILPLSSAHMKHSPRAALVPVCCCDCGACGLLLWSMQCALKNGVAGAQNA